MVENLVGRLFELREALDRCEKDLGVSEYSEIEKAVFSYITSTSNVTITLITKDPYFSKYSFSSIKRAVRFLTSIGIIESQQSLIDKRKMILKLKGC